MTENEGWRKRFRPDIPSTARIYDYLLGGKDNYPADRAAAEQIAQVLPNVRTACQWNRAFISRAIRYLAVSRGIRQFIDVGAGLPTVRNVHEVAQEAAPGSHVVYVDNDPVVLAHGRTCCTAWPVPRSWRTTCASRTRFWPTRNCGR